MAGPSKTQWLMSSLLATQEFAPILKLGHSYKIYTVGLSLCSFLHLSPAILQHQLLSKDKPKVTEKDKGDHFETDTRRSLLYFSNPLISSITRGFLRNLDGLTPGFPYKQTAAVLL